MTTQPATTLATGATKTTFKDQARALLATIPTKQGCKLPVLVMINDQVRHLGYAFNHREAETVGLVQGVSCTKISAAACSPTEPSFFVLH